MDFVKGQLVRSKAGRDKTCLLYTSRKHKARSDKFIVKRANG